MDKKVLNISEELNNLILKNENFFLKNKIIESNPSIILWNFNKDEINEKVFINFSKNREKINLCIEQIELLENNKKNKDDDLQRYNMHEFMDYHNSSLEIARGNSIFSKLISSNYEYIEKIFDNIKNISFNENQENYIFFDENYQLLLKEKHFSKNIDLEKEEIIELSKEINKKILDIFPQIINLSLNLNLNPKDLKSDFFLLEYTKKISLFILIVINETLNFSKKDKSYIFPELEQNLNIEINKNSKISYQYQEMKRKLNELRMNEEIKTSTDLMYNMRLLSFYLVYFIKKYYEKLFLIYDDEKTDDEKIKNMSKNIKFLEAKYKLFINVEKILDNEKKDQLLSNQEVAENLFKWIFKVN